MTTVCKEYFYHCSRCGNVIRVIGTREAPLQCCDEDMDRLVCHTTDTGREKHLPVVTRQGDTLSIEIGSIPHPMTYAHTIEWIVLETDRGIFCKSLKPGESPSALFFLRGAVPLSVYTYCSLHGLWMVPL